MWIDVAPTAERWEVPLLGVTTRGGQFEVIEEGVDWIEKPTAEAGVINMIFDTGMSYSRVPGPIFKNLVDAATNSAVSAKH